MYYGVRRAGSWFNDVFGGKRLFYVLLQVTRSSASYCCVKGWLIPFDYGAFADRVAKDKRESRRIKHTEEDETARRGLQRLLRVSAARPGAREMDSLFCAHKLRVFCIQHQK